MAALITEPASTNPETVDWQALLAKLVKICGGATVTARLTNWDNNNEPQIAAGSRFEVNGSFYECAADESIAGWSAIFDGETAYVLAVPSGGSLTFVYSFATPIWDAAKGGFFSGPNRALFRLKRVNSTTWANKRRMDAFDPLSALWAARLAVPPAEAFPGGKQVFLASGTFNVPAGVTTLYISGCAAGGRGASGSANPKRGGGGGEWALKKPFSVTPGEALAVTIGDAGFDSSIGTFLLNHGLDYTTESNGGALGMGTGAGGNGGVSYNGGVAEVAAGAGLQSGGTNGKEGGGGGGGGSYGSGGSGNPDATSVFGSNAGFGGGSGSAGFLGSLTGPGLIIVEW